MLKRRKTLVVECKFRRLHCCRCKERVRRLSLITYREAENLQSLHWNEGTFPLVGLQEFKLDEDREHVEALMTYHVDYPFRNTLEVEIVPKFEETRTNGHMENMRRLLSDFKKNQRLRLDKLSNFNLWCICFLRRNGYQRWLLTKRKRKKRKFDSFQLVQGMYQRWINYLIFFYLWRIFCNVL